MAESKKFLLRLSPDLFEALRRWAQDDLRSINGQIEYLLAEQARRAGRLPAEPPTQSLPGADGPERPMTVRDGSKRRPRARAGA